MSTRISDDNRTTPNAAPDGSEEVTTVYKVTGMTCGHCETSVRQEISALSGVLDVIASAQTGTVTVSSRRPLAEDAVRAAVDEAGYELARRA